MRARPLRGFALAPADFFEVGCAAGAVASAVRRHPGAELELAERLVGQRSARERLVLAALDHRRALEDPGREPAADGPRGLGGDRLGVGGRAWGRHCGLLWMGRAGRPSETSPGMGDDGYSGPTEDPVGVERTSVFRRGWRLPVLLGLALGVLLLQAASAGAVFRPGPAPGPPPAVRSNTQLVMTGTGYGRGVSGFIADPGSTFDPVKTPYPTSPPPASTPRTRASPASSMPVRSPAARTSGCTASTS